MLPVIQTTEEEEKTMITMIVTYKCKPDMREEFLEMIMTEGIDVSSRSEAGNLKYDYYIPTESSDELLLIEKWKDEDAHAEHRKQPHYARLKELKPEFVTDTVIERFEVQG
jgi:quinol monooxygenase YgiN